MRSVASIRPATETQWLSPEQVCEHVPGMTLARLEDLRKKRIGPPFFKPTYRTVIYAKSDIDVWIRESAVTTRRAGAA